MTVTRTLAAALMTTALTVPLAASAENVLRWTSQGDALTLDPHSQNEGPTNSMNSLIYESLVSRNYELVLEPELAESWEAAPDGWTFKLREGVKFHNGREMTAEDVKYSLDRVTNPKTQSPGAGFFASIAGFDAISSFGLR